MVKMLLPRLDIVEDDPRCFAIEPGIGYVPTEYATDEQKKAMNEYNEKWRKGHEQMTQMIGEPPTD